MHGERKINKRLNESWKGKAEVFRRHRSDPWVNSLTLGIILIKKTTTTELPDIKTNHPNKSLRK